jgi:hypothetical protein
MGWSIIGIQIIVIKVWEWIKIGSCSKIGGAKNEVFKCFDVMVDPNKPGRRNFQK